MTLRELIETLKELENPVDRNFSEGRTLISYFWAFFPLFLSGNFCLINFTMAHNYRAHISVAESAAFFANDSPSSLATRLPYE